MFNNTSMMGMSFAFPDTCLTPTPAGPVPIPYPNMGQETANLPFEPTIFYACGPAHTLSGTTPMTEGDEAGVNMGVASGLESGPERTLVPSMTVFANGQPIDKMTSMTMHNGTNAVGAKLVPSQAVNLTIT